MTQDIDFAFKKQILKTSIIRVLRERSQEVFDSEHTDFSEHVNLIIDDDEELNNLLKSKIFSRTLGKLFKEKSFQKDGFNDFSDHSDFSEHQASPDGPW